MIVWIIILVWVLCGVLSYRLDRALVRSRWGWWTKSDRNFSLVFGILGPIALIVSIIAYIVFSLGGDKPSSW